LKKFEGESLFSTLANTDDPIKTERIIVIGRRGERIEVPIGESNTEDENALPLEFPP